MVSDSERDAAFCDEWGKDRIGSAARRRNDADIFRSVRICMVIVDEERGAVEKTGYDRGAFSSVCILCLYVFYACSRCVLGTTAKGRRRLMQQAIYFGAIPDGYFDHPMRAMAHPRLVGAFWSLVDLCLFAL